MENKSIEATALRPDGARTLYAPLLEINIKKYIKQLKSEQNWTTHDHNTMTIYKSESAAIVLRGMHRKSELKKRQVNGDITMQVLIGKLKITMNDQEIILRKGNMVCIEHGVSHSFVALRTSFFLLTIINGN